MQVTVIKVNDSLYVNLSDLIVALVEGNYTTKQDVLDSLIELKKDAEEKDR